MQTSVLRRTFIGLLALLVLLAVVPVGFAQDDAALLASAAQQTAAASAYEYQFDLALSLSGTGSSDLNLNLNGTGVVVNDGGQPAIDLVLDGSMVMDGQSTPANGSVRLVDNVLYLDAGFGSWTGFNLDELGPLAQSMAVSSFQSGFNGQTGTSFTGGTTDPAAQQALASIETALASMDFTPFIQTQRVGDETLDGEQVTHFTTTVELDDLARSEDTANLLVGLLQLGDPTATTQYSSADLSMMGGLLSQLFQSTSIALDQYVGSDNYLRRSVFAMDMAIDPSKIGQPGSVINLNIDFDAHLSNFNGGQTVEAPPNAMVMSDLASVMGMTSALEQTGAANSFQPVVQEATPTMTALAPQGSQGLSSPTPLAPQATQAPPPSGSAQPIQANTATVVTLNGTTPVDLIYTAGANDTITVVARSLEEPGALDTTAEVLTMDGTRLNFNDDHGTTRSDLQSFDSLIQDLDLPGPGQYIVRVSSFSGAAAGDVEVTVQSGSAPVPQATPQQQATPIINPPNGTGGQNETISDAVPENGSYTHTFSAQQGQQVTITVRASPGSDLDPKVSLLGSNGALLAENDDHEDVDNSLSSFDSRISGFVIPTNGQYTIEISGFAGTGGDFDLTIEFSGGGSTNVIPTATPLVSGNLPTPVPQQGNVGSEQTVQGRVGSEPFIYSLDANAGDVITLTARSTTEGFDPQLYVYDPNGDFLIGNDDHGSSDQSIGFYDSRITNLIIPAAGSYQVEVYGYNDSRGSLDLIITPVATGAPTGSPTEQVVTGEISAGGVYNTTFDAQAGDYVTISVRGLSTDMDPQVALIGPNGRVVADNDDHGMVDLALSQFDSRISNYRVLEAGTYTVQVQGYQDSAGTFAITISTLR